MTIKTSPGNSRNEISLSKGGEHKINIQKSVAFKHKRKTCQERKSGGGDSFHRGFQINKICSDEPNKEEKIPLQQELLDTGD